MRGTAFIVGLSFLSACSEAGTPSQDSGTDQAILDVRVDSINQDAGRVLFDQYCAGELGTMTACSGQFTCNDVGAYCLEGDCASCGNQVLYLCIEAGGITGPQWQRAGNGPVCPDD